MKALANGSLNLSILDGWWDEGYARDFGWAIGHGEVYSDYEFQDETESRDLYNLLEKEVVPLFYSQSADGVPRGWVDKMRAGLRRLVPIFNSHRMVQDYASLFYWPCSQRYVTLSQNDWAEATDLAEWRKKIMSAWSDVKVLSTASGGSREVLVGDEIGISAVVELGGLDPEDVTVEAYYGKLDHQRDFVERNTRALELFAKAETGYEFRGHVTCLNTGRFGFTVRVTP